MRCIFIYLLFLIFFILQVESLQAYNKPYIINFPKTEYGAASKNWSIGQDDRGVLYFGNDIGLLEFDGVGWYLNSLQNGLTVRSVSVSSHKTIFTGGYEEFGRWDRELSGRLKYTSLSEGLDKSLFRNDDFWKIWATEDLVYFQSFNSIFIYDYDKVERLDINFPILFLSKVRNEYWIQNIGGALYKIKGQTLQKIPNSDIFSNTEVRVILPYLNDQYLIGTSTKGIYTSDGSSFKELNSTLSNTLSSMDLNSGLLTSRGTYVLGTILNGIYEIDKTGKILNQISTQNTLQDNTVLSIFEDNTGNIWAGLDRGISYIEYLPKLSSYIDTRGDIGAPYDAVVWEGKLFLGTNQGVFYTDKKNLDGLDIFSKLKLVEGTQGQVWSFSVVGDRLFCCHNRGLKEIHKDLSASNVYGIETGVYDMEKVNIKGKDLLLLSTYGSIQLIDVDLNVRHNLDQLTEPIISGEVDHLDNIWLEHFNKGVYRCRINADLDELQVAKYFGGDSEDDLPYKLKMFKAGGRILLLGDNKFYIYNDVSDEIVYNDQLNECFSNINNIKKVVQIDDNLYWLITDSYIYKFMYDGYKCSILENYNMYSRGLSFINAYENISVINDSLDLICLDNGFLLYTNDSRSDFENRKLTTPFIEWIRVNDVEDDIYSLNTSDKSEIPFLYNSISFGFLATNTLLSNYYFQYILEGVDKDWSQPKKINQVSYARLSPGKYTFKLRTVDSLGNASESVDYEFEILSPWYRTFWAYVVYVLLCLFVFFIIWATLLRRYRNIHLMKVRNRETKRLKAEKNKLEKEVEAKSAELLTQASYVIQRNELLAKIKNELEDYYKKQNNKNLAPLFSKVETLLNDNINTEEDWKMFLISFEQKHTGFFKKLKELYPQLTTNDLKLCACLKLNLDSKDIASLMNISVRAVENSRSRLRKKLNIQPLQHLSDFFLQF